MPSTRQRRPSAEKGARKKAAYHHGDLRQALLAEARRLIAAQGADDFKLREAARAVGVTHRAAYRHFADKRALLAELAAQGFEALRTKLEGAAGAGKPGPLGRLRAIARAYVEFALDDPARFHLMFGPRVNEDRRFPDLEVTIAGTLDVVKAELKRGIDAGDVRPGDPEHLAMSLWAGVHGYAELVLHRRILTKSKSAALDYVDVNLGPLLDGLRPR